MMNIRYSIKTKIFYIILIPSLILLFILYLDYRHLNSLGKSAALILSENYRSIKAAHQIRQHLEQKQSMILSSLFLGNRETGRDYVLSQKISELLRICRDNITKPGEKPLVGNLFDKYEKYEQLYDRLSELIPAEDKAGSGELYYDFISLTASLNEDLNELVSINEKAMEAADRRTQNIAGRVLKYSMGLFILAILFTLLSSYILASRISRPLIRLAGDIANIREGSGNYPRFSIATRDEIGFLTSEFNRLLERLSAYDQLSADKLMAAKLKVRQAEEAKADFIADLSHQLKTPMTSLSMSVNILADKTRGLIDKKYERLMETAREDCARLSALITELVDITRLDAMLKPRTKEVLSIGEVVRECVRPLLCQAEEKGVLLEIGFDPDLPPVAIDSLRFPWVITNLLGNAIRYTDSGGRVTLRATKKGNRCYFECADTGIGIEEKFLPHIFDRFTQFSERKGRDTIGLGLAIVKEIIEQHGGDIRVESRLGEGTRFIFWIPINTENGDEKSTRCG